MKVEKFTEVINEFCNKLNDTIVDEKNKEDAYCIAGSAVETVLEAASISLAEKDGVPFDEDIVKSSEVLEYKKNITLSIAKHLTEEEKK